MVIRARAGRLDPGDRIDESRRLRDKGLAYREIAERLDVSCRLSQTT
jgi:hypothetical protein